MTSRFHHGRQDLERGDGADRTAHAETDAPSEMVNRLLALCSEFYRGKGAAEWLQDQRRLMEVITWPAVWLNERGVGMPVADYEAKLTEIIRDIGRHADVARIKFFPVYLGDCIRKHFIHQGDAIYSARKHVRNAIDLGFLKGTGAPPQAPDVVPSLVAAHAVLATARRAAKPRKADDSQGTLF